MKTFTTKIKKWGSSLGLVVSSLYVKENNLNEDDLVEVEIKVIKEEESEAKEYLCKLCSHKFHTDDDIPYCPICGETKSVEAVENEN